MAVLANRKGGGRVEPVLTKAKKFVFYTYSVFIGLAAVEKTPLKIVETVFIFLSFLFCSKRNEKPDVANVASPQVALLICR